VFLEVFLMLPAVEFIKDLQLYGLNCF